MKYCHKCGSVNSDDALYCPKCGALQAEATEERVHRKKNNKRFTAIVAFSGVMLAGICILAVILVNAGKNEENKAKESKTEAGKDKVNKESVNQKPVNVEKKIVSRKTFRFYDVDGTLIDSRDMEFDDKGNLKKEEVYDSRSAHRETRYYNEFGDPTEIAVSGGEKTTLVEEKYVYRFDESGVPVSADVHCLGYYREWCAFNYDKAGNRLAMRRYHCNEWPWDEKDERETMDYVSELVWKREYDTRGNIRREVLNDVMEKYESFTWQYDDHGMVLSCYITDRMSDNTVKQLFDYTYDASGNVTEMLCFQDGIPVYCATVENEFDKDGDVVRIVAKTNDRVVYDLEYEYQKVFLLSEEEPYNGDDEVQYNEAGEAIPLEESHYDKERNLIKSYRYEIVKIKGKDNTYSQCCLRKEYNGEGILTGVLYIPVGDGIKSSIENWNNREVLSTNYNYSGDDPSVYATFNSEGMENNYSIGEEDENVRKSINLYPEGVREISETDFNKEGNAVRYVFKRLDHYGEEIEGQVNTDIYYYDDENNLVCVNQYHGVREPDCGDRDYYSHIDGIVVDSYGYYYGDLVRVYEDGEKHFPLSKVIGFVNENVETITKQDNIEGHISVVTGWTSIGFDKRVKYREEIKDQENSGYRNTIYQYELGELSGYKIEHLDKNQVILFEEIYDSNNNLEELVEYDYLLSKAAEPSDTEAAAEIAVDTEEIFPGNVEKGDTWEKPEFQELVEQSDVREVDRIVKQNISPYDMGAETEPSSYEEAKSIVVSAPDGYVNFRTGPGTEYDIITPISNGVVLPVYETVNTGKSQWVKTSFQGRTGWVALSQVTLLEYE